MLLNFKPNKLEKTSPDIKYPFIMLSMDYLDIVTYVRADMPDKRIKVKEKDFINFINNNWYVENLEDFETHFYQLKPMILNKSGTWFEYFEDKEKFSFEGLSEFKKKTDEEKEEEKKDPTTNIRERIKSVINDTYEKNKERRKNLWKI